MLACETRDCLTRCQYMDQDPLSPAATIGGNLAIHGLGNRPIHMALTQI